MQSGAGRPRTRRVPRESRAHKKEKERERAEAVGWAACALHHDRGTATRSDQASRACKHPPAALHLKESHPKADSCASTSPICTVFLRKLEYDGRLVLDAGARYSHWPTDFRPKTIGEPTQPTYATLQGWRKPPKRAQNPQAFWRSLRSKQAKNRRHLDPACASTPRTLSCFACKG